MRGRRSLKPRLINQGNPCTSKAENPNMNTQGPPKLLKDYLNPSIGVEIFDKPSCGHDIKPRIFQILPNLYGNINEDPYDTLQEFSKICATIKEVDDSLKLTLFPFSLKGEASYWFSTLEVTTWTKLFNDFIKKL